MEMRALGLVSVAPWLLWLTSAPARATTPDRAPDVAAWSRHVTRLAADAMEGRAPATRGGAAAARYIAEQFEAIGLEPKGDPGAGAGAGSGPWSGQAYRYLQAVPLDEGPSANVIGALPGTGPEAGVVVLTAHYDAYGVGEPDADGDTIYNGALDNATGVAALIELGRLFAASDEPRPRTLVFIATTAEEDGSRGLRFYVEHPVFPLSETVVNVNIDGINPVGPTEDFAVFPSLGTETDGDLAAIGRVVGMTRAHEPWHDGMHFSFDTRVFLERGIVGLTLWQGEAFRGLSPGEARERRSRFGSIHAPGDEWPGWFDPEAVEQHILLYAAAVNHYAGDAAAPKLEASHPFR